MQNTTHLDGSLLKTMLKNGFNNIRNNSQQINNLNVFPVPDGDTGTNMTMTLESGIKSIQNDNTLNIGDFMQKFSRASLFGARGNSGIILSQFIKGISVYLEKFDSVSIVDFTKALQSGVDTAYKSVITPVEGTILTVMREATQQITRKMYQYSGFEDFFKDLNMEMKKSLLNTPNLLPILKETGVIDSGGAGLLYIFEGMEKALFNDLINDDDYSLSDTPFSLPTNERFNSDSELKYGYCTEFILQLQNSKVNIDEFSVNKIIPFLESIGDSIVAVKDESLVKVHVHTFTPGKVLDYCQQFGEFYTLKIENMSVQHNESISKVNHKKYAIVAVASGEGIISYFKEIGCDIVINNGSISNPSVEDFTKAFDSLSADYIIVLPNNSNVILAAIQSADLYKKADVRIIPTKSIAEGYSALSMMDLCQDSIDTIINEMTQAVSNVTTGTVTYSIRDVEFSHITARKGDFIGLDNDNLLSADKNKINAAIQLLENIDNIKDKQVLTVFYGNDVTTDELNEFVARLTKEFPLLEYGLVEGKQDMYSFIFSIE